jgi:hypothetical protein
VRRCQDLPVVTSCASRAPSRLSSRLAGKPPAHRSPSDPDVLHSNGRWIVGETPPPAPVRRGGRAAEEELASVHQRPPRRGSSASSSSTAVVRLRVLDDVGRRVGRSGHPGQTARPGCMRNKPNGANSIEGTWSPCARKVSDARADCSTKMDFVAGAQAALRGQARFLTAGVGPGRRFSSCLPILAYSFHRSVVFSRAYWGMGSVALPSNRPQLL